MSIDDLQKRKKGASMDGFFVGGNSSGHRKNNLNSYNRYHNSRRPTGSTPGSNKSLNSFSKSLDGFKPSGQSVLSSSGFKHSSADVSMPMSRAKAPAKGVDPRRGKFGGDGYRLNSQPSRHGNVVKQTKFGWLRRKNRKFRTRRQKIALRTSAVMGSFLILVGGGLALRAFLISRNIFKGGGSSAVLHSQDVDPSVLKGEGDGRINVLILGKGGPEQHDGPDLTDTIIVASIDPIANEAALLSVPRDFWIKSPSGGQSKINQVYFDAKHKSLNSFSSSQRNSDEAKEKSEASGINAVKQVITDTMGIPVHYHSMVDFAGFKKAIDTVDGVDVNVSEDMAVQENMWIDGRYILDVKAGQQHFDGKRALAFSRSRKTSARGDFARSDRQKAVMIGLKDKVLSSSTMTNPVKLNQLMGDFEGQLGTDFSVNEILRLYDIAKQIPSDKITSINLQDQVGGDTINGLSVQVPKAGLFEYEGLKSYVRNALRDAFLKKEDAKVVVLNGTETSGLATKTSTELKSYGYNIVSIGDAPTKSYQNTVIVDMRNGEKKYTKSYLEKRLKTSSTNSLPDSSISAGDADFVIILGSNETSR